jgi:hypothetical protein
MENLLVGGMQRQRVEPLEPRRNVEEPVRVYRLRVPESVAAAV